MKKFLTSLASNIAGIPIAVTMSYGAYFDVELAINLSQVAFWMIVVISYPVMVLILIGSVAQKDKEKAIKAANNMKSSALKKLKGVIHSSVNIVVMAISGFVWLPVIYFLQFAFALFAVTSQFQF